MTKNRAAISFFVLLLIGTAIYKSNLFSKKKAPRKLVQASQQATPEYVEFAILNRKAFDKGWGRNPFFFHGEETVQRAEPKPSFPPPVSTIKKNEILPPFKLEMIFEVDGRKRAVLSGQLVKEGDSIGSEIVDRIGSDGVVLKKNGKQRTIKLDTFSNPFQVEG
jgi:hypothetical protein